MGGRAAPSLPRSSRSFRSTEARRGASPGSGPASASAASARRYAAAASEGLPAPRYASPRCSRTTASRAACVDRPLEDLDRARVLPAPVQDPAERVEHVRRAGLELERPAHELLGLVEPLAALGVRVPDEVERLGVVGREREQRPHLGERRVGLPGPLERVAEGIAQPLVARTGREGGAQDGDGRGRAARAEEQLRVGLGEVGGVVAEPGPLLVPRGRREQPLCLADAAGPLEHRGARDHEADVARAARERRHESALRVGVAADVGEGAGEGDPRRHEQLRGGGRDRLERRD